MTISDHRDLVAALLGVPGVAAAAVEPLNGGGPGTLRLQLASGADEVDVAGAVNRLLRSRFGLAVDADRVRVLDADAGDAAAAGQPADAESEPAGAEEPTPAAGAAQATPAPRKTPRPAAPAETQPAGAGEQPAGTPTPPPALRVAAGRLVIERVQMVSADLGTTVAVTLRCGARSEVGEAEGAATTSALHRSVATATLRAVEAMVDHRVRFDAEHVEIATTGDERTALVVVSMLSERSTQRLSGASVVREDVRQAVIRGVLAAVNRRVEPMLAEGVEPMRAEGIEPMRDEGAEQAPAGAARPEPATVPTEGEG